MLKITTGTTFVAQPSLEQQQKIEEYKELLKNHVDAETYANFQKTISKVKAMAIECNKEEFKTK